MQRTTRRLVLWLGGLVTSVPLTLATASPPTPERPVELGRVHWERHVDDAFDMARKAQRPVLVLFQEIPGCATCVHFGRGPLSHPLLVDAMQSEFVPVAVYNNRGGADAAALQRYGEPAWNNPVMRFFAPDGAELLERRDGIWDSAGIAARLVAALERAGEPVPGYLAVAAQEVQAWQAERATFAMHCFWQGEAALGGLDGVVATRVGWLDGLEVVEVHYLSARLRYEELLERAIGFDCAQRVFAHTDAQLEVARKRVGKRAVRTDDVARDAKTSDRKWHLQRSALRWLPLTPTQAARLNADLASGGDTSRWLSPRQSQLAQRIAATEQRAPQALRKLQLPDVVFGARNATTIGSSAAAGAAPYVDALVRYEDVLAASLAGAAAAGEPGEQRGRRGR